MRDGGRLAAAIQVLEEIFGRHKPARMALKGWGESARYAGSKDRAFVSGLVLDVLRRRRSLAWLMAEESDRARVIAILGADWRWSLERIEAALADPLGPGAMTDDERRRFDRMQRREVWPPPTVELSVTGAVFELPVRPPSWVEAVVDSDLGGAAWPPYLQTAPDAVRGDYPDWLDPYLERVFGRERAAEGAALATRAPIDLRVNTLKTDTARALKALAPFAPEASDRLPNALRIPAPAPAERAAPVEAAPEFEKGWFEIQDLGSQLAAATAGDIAGKQVLDFCAGGGGKTLALAAAMANTGQLYAYDSDARRLTDTVRRAQRAGVRNLQVRSPIHPDALAGLEGRMDLVFVDAPCTGSGTWRRHPDTKWRLTPEQLTRRIADQDAVLDGAAPYVKPGGRLIYVTCSLLADENEDRIAAFLARAPRFRSLGDSRLTTRKDGTDGFFIAALAG